MNLFFDSSALVKFFHEETGTAQVSEWITCKANTIWLLDLARVEIISAFHRRFRNKEIDEQGLYSALNAFAEQISSFNIEPMGQLVVAEAESLVKRYGKVKGLRTLDALHLAAFLLISEEDWFFVAADKNLCETVKSIGGKMLNPITT